jgi:hypothetical protein
MYCV